MQEWEKEEQCVECGKVEQKDEMTYRKCWYCDECFDDMFKAEVLKDAYYDHLRDSREDR